VSIANHLDGVESFMLHDWDPHGEADQPPLNTPVDEVGDGPVRWMANAESAAACAERKNALAAARMRRYRARRRAVKQGLPTALAATAEDLAAAQAEHELLQSHNVSLGQLDGYTHLMEEALLSSHPATSGDHPGEPSAVWEVLVERLMAGMASRLVLWASDSQLRQAAHLVTTMNPAALLTGCAFPSISHASAAPLNPHPPPFPAKCRFLVRHWEFGTATARRRVKLVESFADKLSRNVLGTSPGSEAEASAGAALATSMGTMASWPRCAGLLRH
jgi:hypothetical protein